MNHPFAHQTATMPNTFAPARTDAGSRPAPGPADGQGWRRAMEKAQIDAWFIHHGQHRPIATSAAPLRASGLAQAHLDSRPIGVSTPPARGVNGTNPDGDHCGIGALVAYGAQAERSVWHAVDDLQSSALGLRAHAAERHLDAHVRGAGMPVALAPLPPRSCAPMSMASMLPASAPITQQSSLSRPPVAEARLATSPGPVQESMAGNRIDNRLHGLARSSGHAVAAIQMTTVGATRMQFHASRAGNRITLWMGIAGQGEASRKRALQIVGLLWHALSQQGQILARAICNGRMVFAAAPESSPESPPKSSPSYPVDLSFDAIPQPTPKEI